MITEIEVKELLKSLIHPEEGVDVVTLGMIEDIVIKESSVKFTLALRRAGDPFAAKLKRFATALITEQYPGTDVTIIIKEPVQKEVKKKENTLATENATTLGKVIAVSSCKGGVGKSTTTANIAVTLAAMGYRVGLLDADIYGPSIPKMFGLEDYRPSAEKVDGKDMIVPAEKYGIKINSIGFFIAPTDALVWRGGMATNALKQLIGQTLWGELDFLLIDLPPGTGDVHLTILGELKLDGAIIVSTPQKIALGDVVRGIEMFRSEKINVPIIGLIENMAWFTPAELPDNRYYLFGKDGCKELAEVYNLPLLGQIPIVQSICESSDNGKPQSLTNGVVKQQFEAVAKAIIDHTK
ncbi:MAG: Mrp/NBP35 family ATP-binding protein [Rikenellaceae bacterium]